eukprot:460069-Prymnesium_polylepis.2
MNHAQQRATHCVLRLSAGSGPGPHYAPTTTTNVCGWCDWPCGVLIWCFRRVLLFVLESIVTPPPRSPGPGLEAL